MASKTLKKKAPAKQAKPVFAAPVVNSARDMLFAGLGVFSVAQQEGEKLIGQGTRLFDKLVSEGARFEKKSIRDADKTVNEIRSDVSKMLGGIRREANENWDSLGNMFDGRVSGALERLGIPTAKDLDKLSGHVKDMSAKAASSWKGLEKVARDAADGLNKLEKEFTERVQAALDKLHIPNMGDLDKLESVTEKRISSVIGKLEATTNEEFGKLNQNVKDVSSQVSENWGRLESVVEERVKVVLGGLGLPRKDDISKLARELNKLSEKVAGLEKQLKENAKAVTVKSGTAPVPKAPTGMTVAERKQAAEAISKMTPSKKPETTAG